MTKGDELMNLKELIIEKYGSQQKFAEELGWTKQKLSKTILKQREINVDEINEIAEHLAISIEDVVNFFRRKVTK